MSKFLLLFLILFLFDKGCSWFLYMPLQAGTCWVVLNIYPMARSLERLTNNFGDKSNNSESLLIFLEIFQTVWLKFDHVKVVGNHRPHSLYAFLTAYLFLIAFGR